MIELIAPALREMWPRAPQGVIDAFAAPEGQAVLAKAGITHTRLRLAVAFAQVEHETNGFTIKDLTENINYKPEGAARIWPKRFPGGAAQVRAKYGSAPGWQLKMFNDVYGNRMGNRPGTNDGSDFIGRAGPQITGRDGYREVGRRANLPLEQSPKMACRFDLQPRILAAFWEWKNLNPIVDAGGLKAATKPWNGGTIGMADREARMRGNDPIVARLKEAERVLPVTKTLPGAPPTPKPPQDAIDATTVKERKARKAGGAAGAAGGGNEVAKTATTEQPGKPADVPLLPSGAAYALIAVGVAIVVVATVLIARKRAAVIKNWF